VAHEVFITRHFPALERDSARHNLILALVEDERAADEPKLRTFTLGGAGACAVYSANRYAILGDLEETQCHRLAEQLLPLHPDGAMGPERTAEWYVARATALGESFAEPMPQAILTLDRPPRHPAPPGRPRVATPEDAELVADWIAAFHHEVGLPRELPDRATLVQATGRGRHFLWIVDGEPVAVARIARRTRLGGCIGPVYTAPDARNRGYGAAITAHVAERLFSEGKRVVALYIDRRNTAGARCYAKLGFRTNCESLYYARDRGS
jgi:ribosomal protein S18 acetylase RimI-like enzyme